MANYKDPTLRQTVLSEVKNGMNVAEASQKYGVNGNTIYNWLKQQADNTGTSALEVARLRKENQELKELVGLLTLEKKRGEKNTGRA